MNVEAEVSKLTWLAHHLDFSFLVTVFCITRTFISGYSRLAMLSTMKKNGIDPFVSVTGGRIHTKG